MVGPSVLFQNARLTDDADQGLYDVLIVGERVASIQRAENAVMQVADQIIDLDGLFIAPSMIDHHVHFSVWAKARKRVSMAGVNSLQDALQTLSCALPSYDPNQFALVGAGLHLRQWSHQDISQMTKEVLDAALPAEIPILVILNDLHSAWCNSAFLALIDITASSLAYTGLLLEKDCFDSMVKLDAMQAEFIWEDLKDACRDAAWVESSSLMQSEFSSSKKGVTEIIDLDIDRNLINWPRRVQKGLNYLRVQCGTYPQYVQDAIELGLPSGSIVPGGEGLLSVGPYKIISDGSLGTRTACCHTAYPSPPAPPDTFGYLSYTEAEFEKMFRTAKKAGLRLAVHAIGDKTHTVVLDVLQKLDEAPLPGSTIEHAQLFLLEDLIKFRDLGLAASIQPQHQIDDIELADRFWPTCTHRAFAYASLHNAGIELKLGSDAPVAPLDPWLAIAAGISRHRPEETEAEAWHPEQRISVRVAYKASTVGHRLQVKEGDVADMCVLERDPLLSSVEQIRNMQVKATLLGGRFTWNEL